MKEPSNSNLSTLKDFPHNEEVHKRYFLDKANRPDDVVRLLENPRRLCCGGESRPIFGLLRCIASLAAIAALVVSLTKDFVRKDISLTLSLVELLLALVAVSTSLAKHAFAWTKVRKQVAKIEDAHPNEIKKTTSRCSIKRPGFFGTILMSIWFIFCSCLIIGFIMFHQLDEKEHSFLKYTKFTTAIIVFLSWIVDSFVSEALQDMSVALTVDQSILLIHGIKEELYHELRKCGNNKRIDQWDKYLRSDSTFNIDKNDRVLAKVQKSYEVVECDSEQTEQQLAEEIAEKELLAIVKKIDKPLKVEFKDQDPKIGAGKGPGRPILGPGEGPDDSQDKNQKATSPLIKKELYESSEAFVVVEMDEVEEKKLIEKS